MLNLVDRVRHAPGTASRAAGNELVVVLPERGKFLVLNNTGAQLWRMVDGQRSLADIAQALAVEWQIEPLRAEADVLRLAGHLLERGALEQPMRRPPEGTLP
jgi:hypothetical protein